MSSLARQGERAKGREIVNVTPQSAGWKYVGFAAYRLAPGDFMNRSHPAATELCIVVLAGRVDGARRAGRRWRDIGERAERVRRSRRPMRSMLPDGAGVNDQRADAGRDRRRQRARRRPHAARA